MPVRRARGKERSRPLERLTRANLLSRIHAVILSAPYVGNKKEPRAVRALGSK